MFNGLFLQSFGVGRWSIGDVLNNWADYGVFDFVLPFLLIFALVFGILDRMALFKDNKPVNGIIALTVALMSLQFGLVSVFFAEIFPRLGVGLAILLLVIILAAFFMDPTKGLFRWILVGIGAIIVIVILVNTSGTLGWTSGYWWSENWGVIVLGIFLVIVIGTIVGSSNPNKEPWKWYPMPGSS